MRRLTQRTVSMDMPAAIRAATERRDFSSDEMRTVMRTIMSGGATPAQIGGFLVGLRMKGETVAEIAAAAEVMRDLASKVQVNSPHLVDTCGTGGDSRGTFNISTTSALVAAAAGACVAKHGSRSVSSRSGSADVLEAAGVSLEMTPQQVAACIEKTGVGFMFAPAHHGAMKHALGPRREMGVRTIFNLLGPLTNPAQAPNQVLGVFDAHWLEPLALVLQRLGSRHVLVVHGSDGMDEITITGPTAIAELKDGKVRRYNVEPEHFGVSRSDGAALRVTDAQHSLAMMRAVLEGQAGPAQDVVVLNAGAAIYAAGLVDTLRAGVARAVDALASGAARNKLEDLVEYSRQCRAA